MDKANGVTIGTPEDLSLNGSLGSFFARKGIVFDPESGLFRVDNEYASQVRLSGSGQRYAMMRKAFATQWHLCRPRRGSGNAR